MQLTEAKGKFIHTWGLMGVNWGINKAMAQVHAYLLIADKPVCADEIMDYLQMSRGNVNINLHALLDWGLIYKVAKEEGCRKDKYTAEKNMSVVFKQIIKQRKKKELEPLRNLMDICSDIQPNCSESKVFCDTVQDIKSFSEKADTALENLIKLDEHWLTGPLMRMIK
jgi:DNA-binding transcriptional regulator GbsR (MarR family)